VRFDWARSFAALIDVNYYALPAEVAVCGSPILQLAQEAAQLLQAAWSTLV
jgi:hypothetical protein